MLITDETVCTHQPQYLTSLTTSQNKKAALRNLSKIKSSLILITDETDPNRLTGWQNDKRASGTKIDFSHNIRTPVGCERAVGSTSSDDVTSLAIIGADVPITQRTWHSAAAT